MKALKDWDHRTGETLTAYKKGDDVKESHLAAAKAAGVVEEETGGSTSKAGAKGGANAA